MVGGKYSLRLKKGDLEIEVVGETQEYVDSKFKELLDEAQDNDFFKPVTVQVPLSTQQVQTESVPSNSSSAEEGVKGLAKDSNITVEQLENIYDFKDGKIVIHKILNGSDAERQKIIARLALIAHLYVKNEDRLSGKALGKYMRDLNIGSLSHLASNLKKEEGINPIKAYYKLNQIGKKEAFDLIQKYS